MNRLKEFRKKSSMTQKSLASTVGVTNDYISILERGIQTPGFRLAKRIADTLYTTVDELNFFENAQNKMFDEESA